MPEYAPADTDGLREVEIASHHGSTAALRLQGDIRVRCSTQSDVTSEGDLVPILLKHGECYTREIRVDEEPHGRSSRR